MKSRYITRTFWLLGLLSFSPFFLLKSQAQDQGASPQPDAAPLQIQDSAASGTMPAPALFAPETAAPASSPNDPPAAAAPASTPAPSAEGATNPAVVDGPAPTNSATTDAAPSTDSNAPAADSGMGSPGQNPPPSDPNSLIPPPAEPEQPSPINSAGNEEKQRQDQKTRYYSVKVQADKDEALVSLLKQADKAKSDESKRQALREYYDLLAKRMKKIDPALSDWIDTMHAAYLRRLEQVRIEPTIPANPPPAADASPTPRKKHRSSAGSN